MRSAPCALRPYARFDHAAVVPLVQLDARHWLLELFHGPTLAFKDVALQLLGLLFERFLADRDTRLTVVGATSGDTGSAAIDALAGRERGRGVHAPSARPGQRGAAPTDDHGAVAQHPQHRDRRRFRRRAANREGDVRRCRGARASDAVGGQFDQLGAADGAGGLLFLRRGQAGRARPAGRVRGPDRQFR